jgi:hypothetical protein
MRDIPISKYVSFVTPYGFLVASLYLFAFWGTFKLNVLEFVGFADLMKLAMYPLAVSLIVFLPGYAVSGVLLPLFPPGGGADTKIGRLGRKYWPILVAVDIVLALALALFTSQPEKWITVAFLLSFLGTPLSHLDVFISLIPNPRARHIILSLLILVIGLAFASGKLQAHTITSGRAAYIVDLRSSGLQLTAGLDGLSYVGYLGENFVLYEDSTKRIIFVKGKDRELLVLKPNPKGT